MPWNPFKGRVRFNLLGFRHRSWEMISVLPIVEELRLMKHFIEGEKMMSMLTRNLGKEDTRWTLATCTMVSSCQDVSPAGSRRCSCLGARIRTVRVWSRAVSEHSRISQCPEKAPTRTFSLLEAPTSALTLQNLQWHYDFRTKEK